MSTKQITLAGSTITVGSVWACVDRMDFPAETPSFIMIESLDYAASDQVIVFKSAFLNGTVSPHLRKIQTHTFMNEWQYVSEAVDSVAMQSWLEKLNETRTADLKRSLRLLATLEQTFRSIDEQIARREKQIDRLLPPRATRVTKAIVAVNTFVGVWLLALASVQEDAGPGTALQVFIAFAALAWAMYLLIFRRYD